MILIIGLGNPGTQYEHTRHNIGREIVQAFQKEMDLPAFVFEKKWNAWISEGKVNKEKVVLALPDTFMNKSGVSVKSIAAFYKIKPASVYIIHDDADIVLGSTKLSFGKRAAGHKGVESALKALKTLEVWRARIGIGSKRDIPAEKVVLKKWTPDEQKIIKKIIKKTIEALALAIQEDPERAMNEYNAS